ncbi:MAG: hypothetical protein JL50_00935 [Peptococcaceae bacterium BICA1-7]|nr:MAG: hypothetical protein JL50_00935 [Peptococcaceae bacterium BICA1-7]HBV98046.1 hypothetical protein [Desulfotomaculum sp.]
MAFQPRREKGYRHLSIQTNDGNLFRYDNTDNQYIYNLRAKDLSPGEWRLRISLGDETSKYIKIVVK